MAESNGNITDTSTDPGKLFVGGISWQTDPDSLKRYFEKFGELKECFIMCDPMTRRSRGFGFITFKNTEDCDKAMAEEHHILDGKKIDPKKAFPKVPNSKFVTKTKKIFVGGIQHGTTEADIKTYFSSFGEVTDILIMIDKVTRRCRGFGFVTFESEESVDKCCEERYHIINSKRVECKKAQPKDVMFPPHGKGFFMSRGIITRPGYLYNRADYSPVIGYFPHQFRPHRTQFVSPTPPRTHGPAFLSAYSTFPQSFSVDRRLTSPYITDYSPLTLTALPATGLGRARELSSSPTNNVAAPGAQHGEYADGYAHFTASPMYSPFNASPSPSNPPHYRTQINGPDSLNNTSGIATISAPYSMSSLPVSSSGAYAHVNNNYTQQQRI